MTDQPKPNTFRAGPDERGHFGLFGGRFVAETLMPAILELQEAYDAVKDDSGFQGELTELLNSYGGRPSPLYYAGRMTEHFRSIAASGSGGGAKIYFKRDELNHTGSHKINNCLGQILLARRMGKTRIIAETGAGQHGVAVATVCAKYGMPCEVYMGATDVERQAPNVMRMRMLGASINPVTSGAGTLKDAMNEALRDWVTNVGDTYYIIGTAAGPHPYPEMVRDFQSIIGNEVREQMLALEGRLPDTLVACIGGGSNAIGLFHPFLDDDGVAIYGVEAGGHGLDVENGHAASMSGGKPGVLHGNRTYPLAGRRRPDPRRPFDFGRPRLSGRRAGTLLAEGYGPRHLRSGHRRRGARSAATVHPPRRHHPGVGALPRTRLRREAGANLAQGQPACDEPLRPRRQGPLHGRKGVGLGELRSGRKEPPLVRRADRSANPTRNQGSTLPGFMRSCGSRAAFN